MRTVPKCARVLSWAVLLVIPSLAWGTDCQPDGVGDESQSLQVYVGTRAVEGVGTGRVFRYAGGTDGTCWADIAPPASHNPPWAAATVMALAYYGTHLYAAVQTQHGYRGADGQGEVWEYQGIESGTHHWHRLQILDSSATVLQVMGSNLYVGTSSYSGGALYRYSASIPRWEAFDGTSWTQTLTQAHYYGYGFRAGIVTSMCGQEELYLGDAYNDIFYRYSDANGFVTLDNYGGSCIWSFAQFDGALYAGAWAGNGQIYRMASAPLCPASGPWFAQVTYSTGMQNWAMAAFRDKLYVGAGIGGFLPHGAELLASSTPVTCVWMDNIIRAWDTHAEYGGVSALAANGDRELYIGLGLPDGWSFDGDEYAEVWKTTDGQAFTLISPSDRPSNTGVFGAGVQCLLVRPGTMLDCNGNGVPDSCDIASQTSQDCEPVGVPGHGIPDECEALDCHGVIPYYDIHNNGRPDCNVNNIPDDCELGDHPERDLCSGTNGGANGVIDACEDVAAVCPQSTDPRIRTCLSMSGCCFQGDFWADANGDGVVDQDDFGEFQRCYTGDYFIDDIDKLPACCHKFDVDCDGRVNRTDLSRNA